MHFIFYCVLTAIGHDIKVVDYRLAGMQDQVLWRSMAHWLPNRGLTASNTVDAGDPVDTQFIIVVRRPLPPSGEPVRTRLIVSDNYGRRHTSDRIEFKHAPIPAASASPPDDTIG